MILCVRLNKVFEEKIAYLGRAAIRGNTENTLIDSIYGSIKANLGNTKVIYTKSDLYLLNGCAYWGVIDLDKEGESACHSNSLPPYSHSPRYCHIHYLFVHIFITS